MTPARAADEAGQEPLELDHRVDVGAVQDERGEAADGVQVVVGEGLGQRVGVGGQEAVRAELGGGQADLAHLRGAPGRRAAGSPSRGPRRHPS